MVKPVSLAFAFAVVFISWGPLLHSIEKYGNDFLCGLSMPMVIVGDAVGEGA